MDYEIFSYYTRTNIRMLRLINSFTQAEVADMLGMSRSSYSALETGKRMLSFYTACALAKLYNIELTKLPSGNMFGCSAVPARSRPYR